MQRLLLDQLGKKLHLPVNTRFTFLVKFLPDLHVIKFMYHFRILNKFEIIFLCQTRLKHTVSGAVVIIASFRFLISRKMGQPYSCKYHMNPYHSY